MLRHCTRQQLTDKAMDTECSIQKEEGKELRMIFATGNAGKMKEIRMIMADLGMEILSMKEAGIQLDIEENGATYEENALIKARAVAAATGDLVLADDSGLEIDYLKDRKSVV